MIMCWLYLWITWSIVGADVPRLQEVSQTSTLPLLRPSWWCLRCSKTGLRRGPGGHQLDRVQGVRRGRRHRDVRLRRPRRRPFFAAKTFLNEPHHLPGAHRRRRRVVSTLSQGVLSDPDQIQPRQTHKRAAPDRPSSASLLCGPSDRLERFLTTTKARVFLPASGHCSCRWINAFCPVFPTAPLFPIRNDRSAHYAHSSLNNEHRNTRSLHRRCTQARREQTFGHVKLKDDLPRLKFPSVKNSGQTQKQISESTWWPSLDFACSRHQHQQKFWGIFGSFSISSSVFGLPRQHLRKISDLFLNLFYTFSAG